MTLITHDAARSFDGYFAVVKKLTGLLGQGVHLLSSGPNQVLVEAALTDTASRLAYTGRALHNRYAFTHASLSGERLRIEPNGFPNYSEISDMVIDLVNRDENLAQLVSVEVQKHAWLEKATQTFEDDPDLLWRIGERTYLDMLDAEKMIVKVVTGNVEFRGMTDTGERQYAFWWSCYSTRDNCPCVHLLEFTQDVGDTISPMHEDGPSLVAFKQVIRQRGHRTSSVSVMASDIDYALPYVHPKRLTRLTFEQLLTPTALALDDIESREREALRQYFSKYGSVDDFVLVLSRDTVISKGSRQSNEPGAVPKQRQEIFDLGESGRRAFDRGASMSERFIMVPHQLLQIAHTDEGEGLKPLLTDADMKLVYTNGGTLDAIK